MMEDLRDCRCRLCAWCVCARGGEDFYQVKRGSARLQSDRTQPAGLDPYARAFYGLSRRETKSYTILLRFLII